jgi:hypothetical protein
MLSIFTPDLVMSLAMLAVAGLTWGGITQIRRVQDRKRGILMLVAAVVLLGNILVLVWP